MLKSQRSKFYLSRKYAYLNCAYMAPMLKKVENAGRKGIMRKRHPYKVAADDFFRDGETLRMLFSRLIENDQVERIVSIPSVSYGMANVAKNIRKKGEVVLIGEQFPSNVYPWLSSNLKPRFVPAPTSSKNRTTEWNEQVLAAITDKTAVVAVANVHWADGTIFDLKAIREKSRSKDALLIVDGTQSIGAYPFSVKELQPDAVICAGYKWLMGPYSMGMAYYGPHFDNGSPVEENWINRLNSQNFAGLVNYQEQYQKGALRYEVGEHSNFILLPMMLQALKQILKWGPENIQRYCLELVKDPIQELQSLGYEIEDDNHRANHLFGIKPPKTIPLEKLPPLFKENKVSVSIRGNYIRVSPSVYNDQRDMGKLVRTLRSALG